MRRALAAAVTCLFLATPALAGGGKGALTVGRLRWDARERPLGFIQFEPRLGWVVSSARRGQRQTAYQILVASEPGKLRPGRTDVWDSQKVVSSESINVGYRGPSPHARQRAFWTVRVWDQDDRPSAFAAPAWWEMGLYDEEWEGQWMGREIAKRSDAPDRSVTYLRKAFSLAKDVKAARLYASAFGVYQMSVNGKPAGDNVLPPGFTDYEKRVLFQAYDVTSLLRRGDNVIGGIVAGGWCTAGTAGRAGACGWEPSRLMAQLEVTLEDGSRQVFPSDATWRWHPGPIVTAHLHDGETYDARREMPGWDRPGFDDADWPAARPYDKERERDLVADPGPPMKVTEDVKAVRVGEPRPGVYVFDLGQNIVGWARLETRAPAGTTITLRYAEALAPDGTLYVANLRGAKATDRYTARGRAVESWEPRFTVHGFRYVEVRGLSSRPALDAITGRVAQSAMAQTGRLETSNALLNRLFANILWSQRAGFLSVPSSGAERRGAMLDARVFAMTACLNFDLQTFYRKWLDDIRDAQYPDAAYADTAPLAGGGRGGPGAGSAGILVPWAAFRCYADRTSLDAHLPSMGRWLELVRAANPDFLWRKELGANRGDPLEIGPATDRTLIATAELAHMADGLAQMVRHTGPALEHEARKYQDVAAGARAAFVRSFVLPDGKLTSDTQTAYALAIALGALSGAARDRAGQHLAAAVERRGKTLSTGVLGAAYLLPALSLVGRDDLAYDLLLQERCPSWLCSVKNGATTIWERWDGWTKEKGFADPSSNSLNQYALGAVGEWMYDAIGGIALDPRAPAGRHVLVRPRPGGGLTHARARYDSLHGPITTEWRREGRLFRLQVSIPANGSATVTLPFGGKSVDVGSGTHDFVVAAP